MDKKEKALPHSGTMAPLATWLRLLRENGGVPRPYWGKLLRILIPTTLAVPLRLAEQLRWGGRIARTRIDKAPIFIIGVARSGTTHLHNLLAQDPQFGAVSTFHAAMPTFFLTGRGWLKNLAARLAPKTRPMDAMEVSMDLPQEEDIAVANTCPLSSVYAITFPKRRKWYIDKYFFMRDVPSRDMQRWEHAYTEVLRKATLAADGQRLVLKSPANTGRIPHLLRLFPEARFIHIVRDPFVVHESLLNLFRSVVPIHQLQPAAEEDFEDFALLAFRDTLQQYLEDRASIPKGQLVELRFEDLEQEPLRQLEIVYETLGLSGWQEARTHMEDYLNGISGYQRNPYQINPRTIATVQRNYQFALDEWGYSPPPAAPRASR